MMLFLKIKYVPYHQCVATFDNLSTFIVSSQPSILQANDRRLGNKDAPIHKFRKQLFQNFE